MDHVGPGSDPVQSVKADERLRRVGHADGDSIIAADTFRCKCACCLFDFADKALVAGFFVVEFISRFIRIFSSDPLDHLEHGKFGIFEVILLNKRDLIISALCVHNFIIKVFTDTCLPGADQAKGRRVTYTCCGSGISSAFCRSRGAREEDHRGIQAHPCPDDDRASFRCAACALDARGAR